ncbi:hypothetical protein [uncultured Brevundimonas sp.]|uniref:HAAS signaling domain-containing protein n=1 Tax=uncultured Brevundimonas sp. TaxID=213418 RepID=UPI0030EB2577|tara:strand:- start:53222 stop:54301 length:1080 start_codon:yes stop_codon:yes gene_type:complete
MTLVETYLRAVAAQLPADTRDDIVAELRDELLTRMEAREAELGRPLSEAEQEAVLRELGHPLAVAARFGSGPQQLVGPELFPWWMFGVRAALTVLVVISVIGVVVRVLIGDADAGQATAQAFHGLFTGAITVVGVATIVAWIIERQSEKPRFLTQWRVRDLGVFEVGLFGRDWNARTGTTTGAMTGSGTIGRSTMSPTARAIASAAAWSVFLLWWTGVLGGEFRPQDLGGLVVADGVDYGRLVADLVGQVYPFVVAWVAAMIVFHLARAALHPGPRTTAAGDLVFACVGLGFTLWIWLYSPLGSVVAVDSFAEVESRVRQMFHTRELVVPTVVMIGVATSIVGEAFNVLGAARRLALGR